jgi:ribosomal protein S18 acetylase RimI-like enzyme
MKNLVIRDAEPSDVPAILGMIQALAEYEREPDAVVATEADLLRDGWGPAPRFRSRIAALDHKICGFTLWYFNYSTWRGRAGIHLEDIYVSDWARGSGVGESLLRDIAAVAVQQQAERLDLSVLTWNPARRFYERLGVRHLDDWLPYRIAGDELRRLAAGDMIG